MSIFASIFGGGNGSSFIEGAVDTYGDLPTPASNYQNKVYYVRDSSGGLMSWAGRYKYPAGFYSPNSSNVWEQLPFSVKVSEDSQTLLNIPSGSWTEYTTVATDINVGDRLIYDGTEYKNITGTQTTTPPNTDTTNWEVCFPAQTLTVAKSGGMYTSIEDAYDAITDASLSKPYVINVYPGVYTENNPIIAKSYVTLRGIGIVQVQVTSVSDEIFELQSNSFIENITAIGATSDVAFSKGTTGNSTLRDVVVIDCNQGVRLNNASGSIFVDGLTLITTTESFSQGVNISAGTATLNNVNLTGVSTAGTVIRAVGSGIILTASNLLSFSPNVSNGLVLGGGVSAVISDCGIVNADTAYRLSTDFSIRLNNCNAFDSTDQGLLLPSDAGTSKLLGLNGCEFRGSTNEDIAVLATTGTSFGTLTTDSSNISIDQGFETYWTMTDLLEGDSGTTVLGEFHVGSSLQPTESCLGAGDSHVFEFVYSFDGTSTYTDRTAAAKSFDGSTFTFDGVTAGNALYIANEFPITFEGVKLSIETAAVIGSGEIVAEYWNGSAWTEFNACTVLSTPPFLKYAKNYFNLTGNYHIKFNPFITDDWTVNDPVSLGTNYYWMRFRIETAITTAPVFEQCKIHTNRAEINPDGTLEYHMDGRTYKKLIVDAAKPIEGNMQDASIYVDENVGVGLANNRFTTAGDLLGVSFELPEDCDTSAPLIFVWKGKFASTGSVNFTVRRKIVQPGDAYTNSEPAASGDTLTVTTGSIAIAASDTREDFRVDLDISDAIPSRDAGFGDEIWITIQYPTRGAGNFDYTKLSANYLSDFNGRHVRQ